MPNISMRASHFTPAIDSDTHPFVPYLGCRHVRLLTDERMNQNECINGNFVSHSLRDYRDGLLMITRNQDNMLEIDRHMTRVDKTIVVQFGF